MLICHCNILTEEDIEAAIARLLEADPWGLIVPAKVYHSMGRRGRCCTCFPSVIETIVRVTEAFHARPNGGSASEAASHLERVRELRKTVAPPATGTKPATG